MELVAPIRSFLGAPVVAPEEVDGGFAFLGVPYGVPYVMGDVGAPCAGAAEALRGFTHDQAYATDIDHHDFDLDGPLWPDDVPAIVDLGDVAGDPYDLEAAPRRTTAIVRTVLERGAFPLAVGGDDSIPIPVFAGYEDRGPINVLHVDAHLDFRDEVGGVTRGYSSVIRRIREMPHTGRIVQVGLRGVGSARPKEVADAVAAGNVLIRADEVHEHGPDLVLDQLPDDAPWFVTIDMDGLDPSIAPGVGWPLPGGLTFPQISTIVRTLAGQGRMVGLDLTEHAPALDVRQLTLLTMTRLLLNVIGFASRASRVPRSAGG
jgi:agmatinase